MIPAAGASTRMKSDVPKQYISIHNKTVLEHVLEVFLQHPLVSRIVVVLDGDDTHWSKLECAQHPKVMVTVGGESRVHSVLNGVMAVNPFSQPSDWVIVHDAARPCMTQAVLDRLIDAVKDGEVGGIVGVPVADTLKKVADDCIEATVDRDHVWAAQTPQMFRYQVLCDALCHAIDNDLPVTDEASAIEHAGVQPKMVLGDARNIKITTPQDLKMAQQFLCCASEESS
ncbi:MAG: 2-C-methyl-D-erythritol 4-phosphate cytidylyltransferase [Gammaproteobacteria bacterium]|nr:2-C-methyl-D-erythritol 4-phosphate cytidylyltransferase [Gammaproteobacteria bacterium]MCH9743911.1 2-C-methyl-D-erythritol 4-phosphate cytidylyltransferase [Gammaproteobacteria bacterium]